MFYNKYKHDISQANKRISSSGTKIANTKLGSIEYSIYGEGLPVLWIHGIFGGADQATLYAHHLVNRGFRIIAISRFGYMGSPLYINSNPSVQADFYAALLDYLKISKVFILGFSAGGPSSIQFALRHADRCSGMILLSAAVPPYPVPSKLLRFFAGKFLGSDFIIWCMINYFPSLMMRMMGVPRNVQERLSVDEKKWLRVLMLAFLPVSLRIKGIMNDIVVSNPDLNNSYPLHELSCPCLVIHSVDDPMPPYSIAKRMTGKIPRSKFIGIRDGGHLQIGHESMVAESICNFIKQCQAAEQPWFNENQQLIKQFKQIR